MWNGKICILFEKIGKICSFAPVLRVIDFSGSFEKHIEKLLNSFCLQNNVLQYGGGGVYGPAPQLIFFYAFLSSTTNFICATHPLAYNELIPDTWIPQIIRAEPPLVDHTEEKEKIKTKKFNFFFFFV